MLKMLALSLALSATTVGGAVARQHGIPLPFPEILHPDDDPSLPEGFQLTQILPPAAKSPKGLINLPREVAQKIADCWTTPGSLVGKKVEATIKISFRADGTPLGPPVFTYVSAQLGSAARVDIIHSVEEAVRACSPVPFTAALGSAIAGRLFLIRFVANPDAHPRETPL